MIKSKEEKLVLEHRNGQSIRSLALKYGLSASRVFRIVKSKKVDPKTVLTAGDEMPDDVGQLKALLRREQLKNELLNNIIDIADKELGTNIRKKSGTRRSE